MYLFWGSHWITPDNLWYSWTTVLTIWVLTNIMRCVTLMPLTGVQLILCIIIHMIHHINNNFPHRNIHSVTKMFLIRNIFVTEWMLRCGKLLFIWCIIWIMMHKINWTPVKGIRVTHRIILVRTHMVKTVVQLYHRLSGVIQCDPQNKYIYRHNNSFFQKCSFAAWFLWHQT